MNSLNQFVSFKLDKYTFLISLYILMPVIDSISGIFHDQFPIGQVYRLILFMYMMLLLVENSRKKFINVIIPFFLFLLIQSIVGRIYIGNSIQDVMKLFFPIVAIVLFECLIIKDRITNADIQRMLDIWSIIYPLLIIIPGLMGIGKNAYEGTVGFKGLFYAVNEISFIMSSLVMYMFWKLKKKPSLKTLIVLVINCLCIVMMGTKTGYCTIALFSILFILSFWKSQNQKNTLKILLLVLIAIFIIAYNYQNILNITSGIFERWYYQRKLSYSTTDFLFSMRLRRLKRAWNIFTSGFYFITGWGFGGELAGFPNMEMDFLDILFDSGIIGFLYIFIFYIRRVIKSFSGEKIGFMILLWSIALAFGAGHVLFYGQSGMMIAINFTLIFSINNDSDIRLNKKQGNKLY